MVASPSPSRGEILRQMRQADRDVRCFMAVSDAHRQALRAAPHASAETIDGLREAAVVVSLERVDDVAAALEMVRKAREWLARRRGVISGAEALDRDLGGTCDGLGEDIAAAPHRRAAAR